MSPENDQCRWVGIRPANPPEDIPVTLGAEVPHVIVDSGGGGDPSPGRIMHFFAVVLGCDIDVWNEVLAVADAGGTLISFAMNPGTGAMADWHLCFTIDGTLGSEIAMDDFKWGNIPAAAGTTTIHQQVMLAGVRFSDSFKIELMTKVDNKAYRANVLYTLDL